MILKPISSPIYISAEVIQSIPVVDSSQFEMFAFHKILDNQKMIGGALALVNTYFQKIIVDYDVPPGVA